MIIEFAVSLANAVGVDNETKKEIDRIISTGSDEMDVYKKIYSIILSAEDAMAKEYDLYFRKRIMDLTGVDPFEKETLYPPSDLSHPCGNICPDCNNYKGELCGLHGIKINDEFYCVKFDKRT